MVDKDLVLIEGGRAKVLDFDDQKLELFEPQLLAREQLNINNARIATLGRRINLLKDTELFKKRSCPDLLTFGGYGLLCLMRGQVDVLLDPFKGQPWYEAVLWGWMAQEAGLVVSSEKGEPINFSQILENAYQCHLWGKVKNLPRVKMVISRDYHLHHQVLERLNKPKVEN